MALSKLKTDMNIVSGLATEPNDVGGLTDDELKAKFDEGPNAIKAYINDTLTAEIDAQKATKEEVQGIILGQILDGTITEAKLASSFVAPIAKGGTGATTAAAARANLGVVDVLTGTTAPTTSTVGVVGQFYLNTVDGTTYQCKAITGNSYIWKSTNPNWKLLQTYTVAGSYTYTIPAGITQLLIYMIGGGGGGGCFCYSPSNYGYCYGVAGGGSGYFDAIIKDVVPGITKSVVIGAGGIGGSGASSNATAGGSTSFDGKVVLGGSAGVSSIGYSGTVYAASAIGGQSSRTAGNSTIDGGKCPYGGELVSLGSTGYMNTRIFEIAKLFGNECFLQDNPFNAAAGGGAFAYYINYNSWQFAAESTTTTFVNGRRSSAATSSQSGSSTVPGTDYGCGGGAVAAMSSNSSINAAAGCDGAVFIYGR